MIKITLNCWILELAPDKEEVDIFDEFFKLNEKLYNIINYKHDGKRFKYCDFIISSKALNRYITIDADVELHIQLFHDSYSDYRFRCEVYGKNWGFGDVEKNTSLIKTTIGNFVLDIKEKLIPAFKTRIDDREQYDVSDEIKALTKKMELLESKKMLLEGAEEI